MTDDHVHWPAPWFSAKPAPAPRRAGEKLLFNESIRRSMEKVLPIGQVSFFCGVARAIGQNRAWISLNYYLTFGEYPSDDLLRFCCEATGVVA